VPDTLAKPGRNFVEQRIVDETVGVAAYPRPVADRRHAGRDPRRHVVRAERLVDDGIRPVRREGGRHGARQLPGLRGRCQPLIVTWRARDTVSSPAGASPVITEPAPMVAPAPISTGATSALLE